MKALFWLWCAACVAGGVAMLLFMFRALDGQAAMFCIGCSESLDKAQAKFEASPDGRGYNWAKFHAAKPDDAQLFCRDSPDKQMRACTLQTLRIDPLDGKPLGVMPEDFYCSPRGCSWFTDWAEVE